jgi:hypothetical protein
MNKLLTTITLLCFSVAANADIYFCEVQTSALAHYNGLHQSLYGDGDTSIIVDTEKGILS